MPQNGDIHIDKGIQVYNAAGLATNKVLASYCIVLNSIQNCTCTSIRSHLTERIRSEL